jgi:hypothetical protein
MSDSLRPWIAGYLIGVAEEHGAILTKGRYEKIKVVQLLKVLGFSPN